MSNGHTDQSLLNSFREEVDTYLLTLQQDLVTLEQDPLNPELLKEMMRAAHTIKGSSQILGFRAISRVMHSVEDIIRAVQDGKLAISQDLSDLLFEALDTVDMMAKAQVNRQELPIDPENITRRLEQVLAQATVGAASDGSSPLPAPDNSAAEASVITIGVGGPAPLVDDRVRVSIERLDGLMQLASEMVITKMQSERAIEEVRAVRSAVRTLTQQANSLRERVGREWGSLSQSDLESELDTMIELDDTIEEINKASLRSLEEFTTNLDAITDELQDTVLNLRMTPVETIFRQFSRTIRDLAKERGKQVNLFTLGGETELDKKVLEGLNEALIHLIRNALDHGIETPEQRTKAGKIPIGQIQINASYRNGQAVVEVSDDGAGIDVGRVKQLATQRGLITAAEAEKMSDDDARQLIFYSGFSTAALITDTSGRGVGMEIVQRVISKLGGSVELHSALGAGTTVVMRLPITMSAMRTLMIRARGKLFALATSSLEDLAYIGLDDIIAMEGNEAIRLRERTIPLFRLDEALDLGKARTERINRRLAEINEEASYTLDFSSGPTLTNDGSAAAAIRAQMQRMQDGDGEANNKRRTVISSIGSSLYNQSYAIRMEGKLPVVVIRSGEKFMAFLVDELVDEREIVVKRLSTILSRIEWVAGTTILGDGSIVVILDGPALVNLARTRMLRLRAAGQPTTPSAVWRQEVNKPRKHILVVDDSVTTRELERSILEAAGYKVDIAVDGVEALAMLAKQKYALAIVDVEMPRMDGFTLTQNIKGSDSLKIMPVIIVSSLAKEEYRQRGAEVGAQAYITKGQFDQNNLLDTIELLTGY